MSLAARTFEKKKKREGGTNGGDTGAGVNEGVIGRWQKVRRQVRRAEIDAAEGGRGGTESEKRRFHTPRKKRKVRGKKKRKSRRRFRGIVLLYSQYIYFFFQFTTGKSRWDQTISGAGLWGAQPGLTALAKMMAR